MAKMMEEVLLESGTIKITPARVVLGSSTYSVANITSVKARQDDTLKYGGVVACFVGFIALALLTATSIILGILLVAGGVMAIVFGGKTEILITTGAAESVAFVSRDAKAALEIASAINLAIMKRSAR